MEEIRDRLLRLREEVLRVSQEAFAAGLPDRDEAGEPKPWVKQDVSRYEAGTRVPADYVQAVCIGWDINPTWLLTGEGSREWHREDVKRQRAADAVRALKNVARLVEVEPRLLELSEEDWDHLGALADILVKSLPTERGDEGA